MKKLFYFLMTLIMLVSCTDKVLIDYGYNTNDDALSKDVPGYIHFGTNFSMPNMTKAIIDSQTDLQNNKFGVFAKINNLNSYNITLNPADNGYFINDDTLAYSASKWALENNKHYFWPAVDNVDDNDPTLNFYAFGPRNIDRDGITVAANQVSIDVIADSIDEGIKDLVYAKALNQTYKKDNGINKGTTGEPEVGYVRFDFEHQLSWVEFKAKYTTDFDTLTLNSITIHVDSTNAVFTINTNDGTTSLTKSVSPFNHVLDTIGLSKNYQVVGGFVALPQKVNDNMTAIINYTATINGTTETVEATVKLNHGTLTETGAVPAPWDINKWEKGYKYIYRVNIQWREILFDVTVAPWTVSTSGGQSEYLIY